MSMNYLLDNAEARERDFHRRLILAEADLANAKIRIHELEESCARWCAGADERDQALAAAEAECAWHRWETLEGDPIPFHWGPSLANDAVRKRLGLEPIKQTRE